ncbi:MAG: type IX secretion system membrane protein PorP/SprF [Bacteroidales bacterium]|jgi:type IX secretion system PorP/SprF family membrane protein|nr:type IX secretion system membrane protein PorP/SprF [Bacteroidales bacterium]MDD4383918.1 type IX secretion system membrane protein PorP/SprF [Bacteroidales bacterium]
MKRVVLVAVAIVLLNGLQSNAQQLPQFTQYMFNKYLINPAEGGTQNYYQMRYNNRFQWVGLTDAPQTYSISAYGPHGSKDMGFGGNLYHDITGPTSRTGGLFSYSYNMQISDNGMRVSGGLSLGFMMFRADGSKFEYDAIVIDPAIDQSTKSVFTPDASIGVLFYSTQYFFGASVHQLFGQKLYVTDKYTEVNGEEVHTYGINKLRQHYMLTGGMLFTLNSDFMLEPSVLFKYMISGPIQVDLNAKVTYRDQFWGGISGRWQDGISLLFGYQYDRYLFGYSFDYSLTGIRKYNAGSHEIMIGYKFDKLK